MNRASTIFKIVRVLYVTGRHVEDADNYMNSLFMGRSPAARRGQHHDPDPSPQNSCLQIVLVVACGGGGGKDDQTPSGTAGTEVEEQVKTIVDDLIKNNKIVVFSKVWCGASDKAKTWLTKTFGAEGYKVYELEGADRGTPPVPPLPKGLTPKDFQDYFEKITDARTVPRVGGEWGGRYGREGVKTGVW